MMRESIKEKAARLRVVVRLGRTFVVGDHREYEIRDGLCECRAAQHRRMCSHVVAARMYHGEIGGAA